MLKCVVIQKSIERNQMQNKKKRILAAGIVAVVVVVGAGIVIYHSTSPAQTEAEKAAEEENTRIRKNKEKVQKAKYVNETDYDGGDVPYQLYDYPFDLTENGYRSNKDLSDSMDQDEMQKYLDYATDYCSTVFGGDYVSVIKDTEAYQDSVAEFYGGSGIVTGNADEETEALDFINALTEMYVDNKLTIEAEYKTDHSLLYQENYNYYIRGVLILTISSTDGMEGEVCEPLQDMFGITAKYGEETAVMVDIGFIPTYEKCMSALHIYDIEF